MEKGKKEEKREKIRKKGKKEGKREKRGMNPAKTLSPAWKSVEKGIEVTAHAKIKLIYRRSGRFTVLYFHTSPYRHAQ